MAANAIVSTARVNFDITKLLIIVPQDELRSELFREREAALTRSQKRGGATPFRNS
jgi:hypothetical protein